MANNCSLEYTGKDKSIFFLSRVTCAGDEIGWDFISMVQNTKTSFTALRYRTINMSSAPFMNIKTFVNWIFAWMARMEIDFRREVDPWCKHKPMIVVCDGTHIGVSSRYLKLDNPVTASNITWNQ